LFAEEICAEYIFFADEWPNNAIFCGINFCGWRFLKRFCRIKFCGCNF